MCGFANLQFIPLLQSSKAEVDDFVIQPFAILQCQDIMVGKVKTFKTFDTCRTNSVNCFAFRVCLTIGLGERLFQCKFQFCLKRILELEQWFATNVVTAEGVMKRCSKGNGFELWMVGQAFDWQLAKKGT